MTARDPLAVALDRFDVPAMSSGLVDRIVGVAVAVHSPPTRRARDRRGMWRRGRQVVLGSAAIILFSAGAVASGLLGRVGIEVPVLSAMLAPVATAPTKHVLAHKAEARHVAQKSPAAEVLPAALPVMSPAALPPAPMLLANTVARAERQAARRQFAAEHPAMAANIRHRVIQRLQERAIARRAALAESGDPARPSAGLIDPAARESLAREDARDRRRAAVIIDRRIAAWNARRAGYPAPVEKSADVGDAPLPKEGRNAPPPVTSVTALPYRSWSELSAAERQSRISRFRSREARRNLSPLREGNPSPVR